MGDKLLALLIVVAGIASLVAGSNMALQTLQQSSWPTTAVVNDQLGSGCFDGSHLTRSGGTNDTLTYQVNGRQYTIQSCISAGADSVRYDPADPTVAAVNYGKMTGLYMGVCLLGGTSLVLTGLFGRKGFRWAGRGPYEGLLGSR